MQTPTSLPKPLLFIYGLFAVIFAVSAFGMFFSPQAVMGFLAPNYNIQELDLSWLHKQIGIGFLIAAVINIFCLFPSLLRTRLHTILLIFSLLTIANSLSAGADTIVIIGMIIGVAIYALPLVPMEKKPAPTKTKRISKKPKTKEPRPDVENQEKGEIKWFNPNKGFGFILAEDGREVFVHFRAVSNGGRRSLQQGVRVSFSVRTTERGEQAEHVFIHRK